MTEIPIIMKLAIALIFLLMFAISAFCTWRVLEMKKRVKQVQEDRNKLLEERCSDIMFRTIKEGEKVIGELLSELEKRLILNALNMPEYKNATENPDMKHDIILPVLYRKTYRGLVEKIKESLK